MRSNAKQRNGYEEPGTAKEKQSGEKQCFGKAERCELGRAKAKRNNADQGSSLERRGSGIEEKSTATAWWSRGMQCHGEAQMSYATAKLSGAGRRQSVAQHSGGIA